MHDSSVDEQKRVAYYSAAVSAWFTSSLEYDRSLLTLSAAGIGLHLTLLTTVGVKSSEALVLYIGAILSFAASLLTVLRIFRVNQTHIEGILTSNVVGHDPALRRLDLFAIVSFGVAVALSAVVGIGAAINSYTQQESSMATQKPQDATALRESANGAVGLQPPARLEKSFNGAASIQPPLAPPTVQVPQAAPQAAAPATQTPQTQQSGSPPPAAK